MIAPAGTVGLAKASADPAFDRRLTPARPDLAAARLRGQVRAARFAEPIAMTVTAPVADMRPAPDPAARLDTQLLHGEAVAAYEIGDDWVWAQAETDGYVGYLPRAALTLGATAPSHRVIAAAAHIYAEPDIKAAVLARLPGSALLAVAEQVGGRGTSNTMARLATGGYVPSGQIRPIDSPAADWVAVAEGMMGVPYLWGGRSGDGLDCSSLLQLALAAAGHAFPRDSDMQAAAAPVLSADTPLRRGDLVFWRGHVGVMLDAQTLLHANAFAMQVAAEPLAAAAPRIAAAGDGPITQHARLALP